MRKTLLLSLTLLSAVSTFATVKTVTLPAVQESRNCSFIIRDIPDSLGVTEEQQKALNTLVGNTYEENTTVYFYTDSLGNGTFKDTLKCEISIGRKVSLMVNDTILCAEDSTPAVSLMHFNDGFYWRKDPYSGVYTEVKPHYNMSVLKVEKIPDPLDLDSFKIPFDSTRHDSSLYYNDNNNIDLYLEFTHLFNDVDQTGIYLFSAKDTLNGCNQTGYATITVKNCKTSYIHWFNYDGPKEYHAFRSDDYLSYLKEDSIYVLDPFVNCICKLPLDTIVESTQSEDPEDCEHYKYDVTVKLAATVTYNGKVLESDTIVAYVLHLDDSGSSFEIAPDTAIATFNGNCVFTVPEIRILRPSCDCGSYYYTQNLHTGDTITKSSDIIFTFRNYCKGDTVEKVHVLVPDDIRIFGNDTSVYAKDSTELMKVIYIDSRRPVYNSFTHKVEMTISRTIELKGYFNSIAEDSLVLRHGGKEMPILYFLDNVNKTGTYYFVARDTMTGCEATENFAITVLGNDSTPAPLYLADIYDVKGNIYTVSGAIVMKNVYLKDVKDILKEGIYIFNNKKIYINRKK
ncbi:MAG: hypothetical protein IJ263_11495 [Paludibacteraceae bacterium]|nr:hypothetical protein [Paludibacteraceae bacterium]